MKTTNNNVELHLMPRQSGKSTNVMNIMASDNDICLLVIGNPKYSHEELITNKDRVIYFDQLKSHSFPNTTHRLIIDELYLHEENYVVIYKTLCEWLKSHKENYLIVYTTIPNQYDNGLYKFVKLYKYLIDRSSVNGLEDTDPLKHLYFSFLTDDKVDIYTTILSREDEGYYANYEFEVPMRGEWLE